MHEYNYISDQLSEDYRPYLCDSILLTMFKLGPTASGNNEINKRILSASKVDLS